MVRSGTWYGCFSVRIFLVRYVVRIKWYGFFGTVRGTDNAVRILLVRYVIRIMWYGFFGTVRGTDKVVRIFSVRYVVRIMRYGYCWYGTWYG